MRKHIVSILLASALVFVATGCATYSHSTAWEYKVLTIGGGSMGVENNQQVSSVQQNINRMTQQGWHLVSISPDGTENQVLVVFKRRK